MKRYFMEQTVQERVSAISHGFDITRIERKIIRLCKSVIKHSLLLSVSASCVLPLLWMVSSSLKSQSTILRDYHLIPAAPQWQNYAEAWTDAHFGLYFLNSVFYTACVVLGVILISSLAAYAFARLEFPGKNILFILFLTTMMIPVPGAFVAVYVLLMKLHLINTRAGYILPQINGGLAFGIFLLKTFFEKLPKDLEDAARIDGCGKLGIWWHVALPLAKPAIAVLVIFNVMSAWNEYLLATLVFSGDKALNPLQVGLMAFQGVNIVRYPQLMAGITITVVPIIIVYLLMQKYIIKGIMAGSIKG